MMSDPTTQRIAQLLANSIDGDWHDGISRYVAANTDGSWLQVTTVDSDGGMQRFAAYVMAV